MNFNAKSLNSPVKKLQLLLNKKGSSLIIVLVSFAVLMIMGAALVIVVSYNHKNATDYHKKQQAQYTARGVMESLVSAFSNPAIGGTVVAKIPDSPSTLDGSGDLTADNMGSYKVMLNYTDGSKKKIKADVIATYQGMSYKLTAYFKQGKGDRLNPLDFVLFCKDGGLNIQTSTSLTPTNVIGNVYTKTSATYTDINFEGKFLTFGGAEFGSNSSLNGRLIANAATKFRSGSVITGEAYHYGTLSFDDPANSDRTTISKSLPTSIMGMSDKISQDQRKWKPIDYILFQPSNNFSIGGVKFHYNNMPPPILPSDASQVGSIITLANGDTIDATTKIYTSVDGDIVDFSTPSTVITTPAPITSSTGLISTVTAGKYNLSSHTVNSPVMLDTTAGDVHLYASNDFIVGADITVSGENNVYIHLNGKSMTVQNAAKVGGNGKSEHQLFIEGDGSTLNMKDTSTLHGAAYLGEGTYNEPDKAVVSEDKINGSITAKIINITKGNSYTFSDFIKEPYFNATLVNPDDNAPKENGYYIYPQNTTGEKDWVLEGYKK